MGSAEDNVGSGAVVNGGIGGGGGRREGVGKLGFRLVVHRSERRMCKRSVTAKDILAGILLGRVECPMIVWAGHRTRLGPSEYNNGLAAY